MKKYQLTKSRNDLVGYVSELDCTHIFFQEDRAEITFPDGSKQVYVLKMHWEDEETGEYILRPDNG